MVEVVVVDVVGGSWQTGDGSQPCCPAMMPPGVVGEVAAVGEDAAAAAAAAAAHAAGQEEGVMNLAAK